MAIDRNPLKVLREHHDWTLESLASKVGCSKVLLIRAEQGCYPEPMPILMEFWTKDPRVDDRLRPDPVVLRVEYREFQRETRKANYGALYDRFNFKNFAVGVHPFVAWRESSDLNPTQVCKLFCLHPSLIYKFETQHWLCNDLPKPLVEALNESGYRDEVLTDLSDAFHRFKRQYSDTVKVTSGNAPGTPKRHR